MCVCSYSHTPFIMVVHILIHVEPSCLRCYGYSTNTSSGRFQVLERQQTHLPFIPPVKALQMDPFISDGCFDRYVSFREPMTCTSVWSVREQWKMKQTHAHGVCVVQLQLSGTLWILLPVFSHCTTACLSETHINLLIHIICLLAFGITVALQVCK